MNKILLIIVLLAGLHALPGLAKPVMVPPAVLETEDLAKIRNVILRQLDAFRIDDADKAFSFATPQIQQVFKTAEIFLHTVRRSYRSVYRPRFFEFRDTQHIEGNIVQPLTVVGSTGVPETALYIMKLQPDGTWKIGACIMVPEPGKDT